ncbi:MAG: hypothetical protein ACAF41_19010 [Leptolyngbya sp. BL-A-14]
MLIRSETQFAHPTLTNPQLKDLGIAIASTFSHPIINPAMIDTIFV